MANNWLSLLIALIFTMYNLYSKFKNKNSINLIIDDMKENINSSSKVGIIYKVKFVLYVFTSIYSLCYLILKYFDDEEYSSLKIFS